MADLVVSILFLLGPKVLSPLELWFWWVQSSRSKENYTILQKEQFKMGAS